MQTILQKTWILIFCFMFLGDLAEAENNNTKLKQVLGQITNVKIDIIKKQKESSLVTQQLNTLKNKIGILMAGLKETTKNLNQQKKSLLRLTKEQAYQQSRLQDAQSKLSSQINFAYQVRLAGHLQKVFNKKRKITPELLLNYHKYVFMVRLAQMHNLEKVLTSLEQNRRKLRQQTQNLERLEKKQQEQRQELEAAKKERNQVLVGLKNNIEKQNKKLKQLLVAKRKLEELISTLVPYKIGAMSPELKARFCRNFIWPTKGVVTTHFGSPIEQSSWKWNGVIISAPENQEIRSIAAGKVIYADRLTGYGLLLIIDHGNGYMSLYGHNSSIRKKLNAEVVAGEVVATVGTSGSEEPELYFGIRYNGKPIDPEKWCHVND